MTSERAQAYGRLMRTVRDESPDPLTPAECALIREAADCLLFCDERAWNDEARQAFERVIVPRDFDSVEIPFPERGEPVHVRAHEARPVPAG